MRRVVLAAVLACGCRSSGDGRRNQVITQVGSVVESLRRDAMTIFASDSDADLIRLCVAHDDQMAELSSLTPEDTGTLELLGRASLDATHVLEIPRDCRSRDIARPGLCVKLCVNTWLALVVDLERIRRAAGAEGSKIPSFLGTVSQPVSLEETNLALRPTFEAFRGSVNTTGDDAARRHLAEVCSQADVPLRRVASSAELDHVRPSGFSIPDQAVWLMFYRHHACREGLQRCVEWCEQKWRELDESLRAASQRPN